jgi:hypothetical protein
VVQSVHVNGFDAGQHLEVIRTLMERSAIYRRALAPTMLMLGILGILGGAMGFWFLSDRLFAFYWMGIGVIGLGGSYFQMRRQALSDQEGFWSPPTKRVTQALLPALMVGAVFGLISPKIPTLLGSSHPPSLLEANSEWWLPPMWMLLYGCAIHAAGFFMPRGFKLFGWSYIAAGAFVLGVLSRLEYSPLKWAHLVMAVAFGLPHLAYGIYLNITERNGMRE